MASVGPGIGAWVRSATARRRGGAVPRCRGGVALHFHAPQHGALRRPLYYWTRTRL